MDVTIRASYVVEPNIKRQPGFPTALFYLSSDLLIGVLAESTNTTTAIDILLVSGGVICAGFDLTSSFGPTSPTPAQVEACARIPVSLDITDVILGYANNSFIVQDPKDPKFPANLAVSIHNALQALVATSLRDIGIWNHNSIFSSSDMFNATILPNFAIDKILGQTQSYIPYPEPSSEAAMFRADSDRYLVDPANRTPSVIAINYLCHDQRRKSLFSLITGKSEFSRVEHFAESLWLSSRYCGRHIHIHNFMGSIYALRFIFCVPGRHRHSGSWAGSTCKWWWWDNAELSWHAVIVVCSMNIYRFESVY